MKIIYIAGLGHSGSTILDMSLGCLQNVVGLGELKSALNDMSRKKHMKSTCSCGKKGSECKVWEEIDQKLKTKTDDASKIDAVISAFKESFSTETVLVDSSKNSNSYLKYLKNKHELTVIYLTRDVRSWSYSRHKTSGKPLIYFILRWIAENHKIRVKLKKMGLAYYKIGYEELSLYPEYTLKKLADALELPYEEKMLVPSATKSHIISGNIARVDDEKKRRWVYDARWMLSARLMLWSPVFLMVMPMNRKFVYSNILSGQKKELFLFNARRRGKLSEIHN